MRLAVLLMAVLVAVAAARADSWSRPPLGRYEGRTIVTGTDLRSRPAGLAACLRDVLAKVSGDASVLDDPSVTRLQPETLLGDYDYFDRMSGLPHHDEQGSSDRPFWLTVRFDPARIDAALRDLGRTPYTGLRPIVVPVVSVWRPAIAFVLIEGASRGTDHRAAFAAAADRVGIPLRLPSAAEVAEGVSPAPDILPLSGSLVWSEAAHGWIARWDADWQGRPAHWEVSGVSFDEAYRVGLRGALGLVSGHPLGQNTR